MEKKNMKLTNITKSIAICIALLLVSSQFVFIPKSRAETTSMEDVKKELKEAMENYSADRKEDTVNAMKKALETMDHQIAQLGDKIKKDWKEMEPEAREKANQAMENLRRQREKMAKYMDELKDSSTEAWNKLKEDFMKSYDEFKDELEDTDKKYDASTTYL